MPDCFRQFAAVRKAIMARQIVAAPGLGSRYQGIMDAESILANARNLTERIVEERESIEANRRLPPGLLDEMSAAGVFRIAMPKAWGGPEMNPLDQIELIETLAYADPSVAWCTSILSDSGFYAGFLEESVARKLFPSLDARCAGMLAPIGQAEAVKGGYRVTGHWAFGSGSLHATHITGGCLILENGKPVIEDNGLPRWRVMIFDSADVEILDTWHTTGLRGSGSNDYRVSNVFVPTEHTFDVMGQPRRSEPLYRYHGFFFANVPGVPLGMARAALDEARHVAETKRGFPTFEPPSAELGVRMTFGEAEAQLGAARAFVSESIGEAWESLLRGDALTLEQRARIGLCITFAGRSAERVIEVACEIAGSQAIYQRSRLEGLRRDMITVSSHIVHQRKTYGMAGGILLGAKTTPTFF